MIGEVSHACSPGCCMTAVGVGAPTWVLGLLADQMSGSVWVRTCRWDQGLLVSLRAAPHACCLCLAACLAQHDGAEGPPLFLLALPQAAQQVHDAGIRLLFTLVEHDLRLLAGFIVRGQQLLY